MRARIIGTTAVAAALATAALAGCSDKTNEQLQSAATNLADDARGAAAQGGARGSAETFRGLVKSKTTNGQSVRTMAVLTEAQSQVPGNTTITGVVDGNGDGLDDDGYVQFALEGRTACVVLPATGDNTEVTNDPCPAS